MRRLGIGTAIVCTLSAALWTSAADAPPKPDRELLQGTWRMTSAEMNGRELPPEFIAQKETLVVIAGDRWTETVKGEKEPNRAVFKLDSTQTPRHIDLTDAEPEKGAQPETTIGIYEVRGDTLKVCVVRPGVKERPKEFRGSDKNTFYRVFARVKP